ncbi:MAG: chromosomal replication initiator protein DnaA, partial [Planctomycetota bacterium]
GQSEPLKGPKQIRPVINLRGQLNPHYTFDRFVVGACNRLAHAATLAVAENPSKAYNPLFIHGAVGLGKTHLLQAACWTALEKNPRLKLYYLSCENFVNDYISAVKRGACEEFRNKYRSADILAIDDIHFLGVGEKIGSQEEFFHTFNALHNAQKQIILSSDSPPQEIPTLTDRLVSRFKWGMVVRLDPPTFELRMAILKQKAELKRVSVPDDTLNFIATLIDSNIRELEGGMNKVIASASLLGRPINLALAQEALKDTGGTRTSPISVNNIQEVVSNYFNIKIAEMQSKKRVKSVSFPRQVGIYLARTLTDRSLEEIGAAFGGKDHTTVMYSVEKIKHRLHRDKEFQSTVNLLISDLKK